MRYIMMMLAALLLAGCSTSGEYRDYLTAQHEANKLAANQPPLFRLTAQDGQAITGLKSVEVFMPQAPAQIQQARPNEWAGVLNNAISTAGGVGQVIATGRAAVGIADSVGKAATLGYSHIQAPGAVTTIGDNSGANSGNSGRIAGGDQIDSTSAPTVVLQPEPVVVEQPAPLVVTVPQ
ncbi:hypothetical protein [Aromatoleum anaerobium]|uniref:Lipoprotein n=1 Tax=Aromatoleum anaerobium TaxID=182180 RepID=A0ABX1PRH2_9RHOO|nr:hypothetical protein [Aromatoleum anaerobium]MCK0507902.1 hypothetical protein [Aromatoleum anaerobium]